ncbi:hypothetical protein JCM8547_008796 [Rhodosporidiobolus lusitaniae]
MAGSPPTSPRSPTQHLSHFFKRSKSRPHLPPVRVPPPPSTLEREEHVDCRPKSPSVILSPSTPDFPTVGLPPLPHPQPTELVAAQVLPSFSSTTSSLPPTTTTEDGVAVPRPRKQGAKKEMDPTLRHSLALLDMRLAEVEQLGGGGMVRRASYQDIGGAGERGIEEEEEERLAGEEGGENGVEQGGQDVRLSQPIMAPFSTLAVKDVSINSLSSLTSGTSSSEEDAFDIADFPSLDQLGTNYELGAPPPRSSSMQRKRSSDLMAFPIPPALPSIPLRRPPAPEVELDTSDDNVFEHLADMGPYGGLQGLGLFSSVATTVDSVQPSPLLSQTGRRSRSSSTSSRSSLSSKEFDASTLASSAANFSYRHDKESDEPFPPELTSTIPLFTSPMTAQEGFSDAVPATVEQQHVQQQQLPKPINALTINIGSAHPALASPFVENGSNFSSPSSLRSPVADVLSPTSGTFSTRSSSLRPRVDSNASSPVSSGRASPAHEYYANSARLGELDLFGILTFPSPRIEVEDEQQEELIDPQPSPVQRNGEGGNDRIRIVEPAEPPSPSSYGQNLPLPHSPSGTFSTLRRLSSFGLLKRRKSEGVLKEQQQQQPATSGPSRPFGVTKRKSEAALSNLLRSSKSVTQGENKENSPALPSVVQQQAGPNKLTRRSVSSPKLSKLFFSPTSPVTASSPPPPLPTSPIATADPTSSKLPVRPRALSFGESGEEGTSKMKKHFSMHFGLGGGQAGPGEKDSNGETIPPLPPTPKEHLPAAKQKAPAGMFVDVAKANELDPRKEVERSPAPTLEISATPSSATGSSFLFSPSASPAESAFPQTPISPSHSTFSRSAVPVAEKPFPSPLLDALSPPASPAGSSTPQHDLSGMSLATFLKATDPDQQMIVKRPARTSSFFQPSSVFPPASSNSDHQSRSSSRAGAETPSSAAHQDEAGVNWSRPSSPALLDALRSAVAASPLALAPGLDKQVFPLQEIIAFPFHATGVPGLPPSSSPPTFENGHDDDGGDSSSGEDDYGSNTSSEDEDDKPLGVVVPGALTAQKSLRVSAAKRSRSERKAREQAKKDKEIVELARRTKSLLRKQASNGRMREDPFELEHTAAMVATPPMSHDGHGESSFSANGGPPSKSGRPALSPIASVGTYPSCSTITSLHSSGHDSLLPQTDASIERRAAVASMGMKRSPSTPLDPLVANSSLTMDSPVMLADEPLPQQPVRRPSLHQTASSSGRARSGTVTRPSPPLSGAPPMPSMRPPPAPPASSQPLARRPSLHPQTSSYTSQIHSSPSSSPSSTPHTTPQLGRRPSLHPDGAAPVPSSGMDRRPSAASSRSASSSANPHVSLSRQNTLASRTRSATTSSNPTTEQKVYLEGAGMEGKYVSVPVGEKTVAGEMVAFATKKGALGKPAGPKEALEGGWALWEVWKSVGIERPIREYEFVSDIIKSWDDGSAVYVFRRTPLWPILSSHARLHPTMPRTGQVQLEVKKGKWSKRFLEMKDGAISYSKTEKGKDATVLCQLSNFDVFFVSPQVVDHLKAPKPFVFALKSRLTRAHFEEKSEWCHFLSTKTADEATSWVKTILEAGNAVARQREQAVLGASTAPSTSSPFLSGPLIPAAAFSTSPSDVPPVPALPIAMTPAAAIAAAARNPSRPAPPILAQRSQTLPLGQSVGAQGGSATLQRNNTVAKPTTREWGAMGEQQKHQWTKEGERLAKQHKQPLVDLSGRLESWLSIRGIPTHSREAAEALELSLTAQAALAFEQEAGEAERRVWDEAVRWCRERWGGEGRRRLAAAAAVNRINSRAFRERGRRREDVKDLVSDLELLFLQAGVLDDEAMKRAFVGCFFEFPKALHRLSRTSSYSASIAAALEWEGQMIAKERETLTSHLRSPYSSAQRRKAQRDPSSASTGPERPVNPTPGGTTAPGLSPVQTRFAAHVPAPASPVSPNDDVHFRDDDLLDPTDALVAPADGRNGFTAARNGNLLRPSPYAARSVETLHALYPSSTRAEPDHAAHQPRAHSSLAAYPSPESQLPSRPLESRTVGANGVGGYKSSCAGARNRGGFPSFSTPPAGTTALNGAGGGDNLLLRPSTSSGPSNRALTPPFVTEATSFSSARSSLLTSPSSAADGEGGEEALYDRFPYPSRPSPSQANFSAYATRPISQASAGAFASRLGGLRGKGRPPLSPSAGARFGDVQVELGAGEGGGEERKGKDKEKSGGGLARKGTKLVGALFRGHGRSKSLLTGSADDEGKWIGGRKGKGSYEPQPFPIPLDGEIGRPPKKRGAPQAGGMGLPP